MDVLFLIIFCRLYPGFKILFENNTVRKNLFLSVCFFWNSRLSLREMDQKYKFGGNLGYGDSYMVFLFRHFKVFIHNPKLYDAAGALPAHSGKSLGHCYMIGWGPNSCFLGHVTGLFLCFYEKLFCHPFSTLSIFEAVCFALYYILSWQIETL